jgi:phosphoribosylglycinamide formyltransferase
MGERLMLETALPGKYNGAGAIERAHKDFVDGKITETGVMIHYVSIFLFYKHQ